MRYLYLALVAIITVSGTASADAIRQTKGDFYDAFRQLDVDLPTANVYRTASGAPGPQYWQQRADFKIKMTLDEANRRISASETITYTNASPDPLRYLWMQVDQNRFADESLERRSETAKAAVGRGTWDEAGKDVLTYGRIAREQLAKDIDYGFEIERVADSRGRALPHTVVDTMMRIDLAEPLAPGKRITFSIDWSFNIVHEDRVNSRGGYEHFRDTDTYIYFLAQWYPRLAAYTDYAGWQHKAFLGRGEFTLEFGDYEVEITVPADHIVSATGALQNPGEVLSAKQRSRLSSAGTDRPVFIVTPEEALENEQEKSSGMKTWKFKADNVRDFAWASSRKFIWDAMIHRQDDRRNPEVLAMSFYPNEAEPIWSKYSTHAVAHTMDVYSRFSFAYPYPTAQSVNTWKRGGMEYPMITFNGYRPEPFEQDEDKPIDDAPVNTYSRRTKYGLIGVIIHEIGHTYFPMIVNSDERQWTWMDEGINSFLEYMAEFEWEEEFPAYRPNHVNVLDAITDYMVSEDQVPIMTNSDSLLQFGPNAYSKPVASLIVLRETVMGRELFDFAFKEYARRWKFKRPTPADLFRTMEDASGIDLDWFWRGWYYSTDHVDVALTDVREYKVSTTNPDVESEYEREKHAAEVPEAMTQKRNREEGRTTYLERHPELADFYNENDQFTPSNADRNAHTERLDGLEDWEYDALVRATAEEDFIYFVDFENIGGLPTPLPLLITDVDGNEEFVMLPAEIWRRDYRKITKLLIRDAEIKSIELDPNHQIADADFSNNHFPRRIEKSRIELYKSEDETRDLMGDMLETIRERKGDEGEIIRSVPLSPAH
ncbi:MAG: M1 family metallopeptidase [Gammaproteobacteria bacterium]|nr:M1 family metallopeptidase [Gammaproteobacteria bacterium]